MKSEGKIISILDELVCLAPNITRVICDVGANSYAPISEYFVQKYSFSAYLFEPQDSCVLNLKKRFENYPNVSIIKAALGSESTIMPFFESADGPGGECATLYDGNDPWSKVAVNKSKKHLMQVYKGKEIFAKHGIKNIGILKIDTEGFDFDVLRGIELGGSTPSIIVTEEYLWNRNGTLGKYDYLDSKDYVLLGFVEYNSIWVKRGFADIISTKIMLSNSDWYPKISSLLAKLDTIDVLLKRSHIDTQFSLNNTDLDIGIKSFEVSGRKSILRFFIFNRGDVTIPCLSNGEGRQIFVSYHISSLKKQTLLWDGERVTLKHDIQPKECYSDIISVDIPNFIKNQKLYVNLDILDEGYSWYSSIKSSSLSSALIDIN